MTARTYAELSNMIGEPLGRSSWKEITQKLVNEFAHCTGDMQWIHVNVVRAKAESPFGGPVAHGYLTLSLLSVMAAEIGMTPKGTASAINYGLDAVRFIKPVPVGARLRLQSNLISFERRRNGHYLAKTKNVMEIEGSSKPALLADSLALFIPGPNAEE